jgi:hypothetical protein
MNANHLTTNGQKKGRYIRSQLILHGVTQREIADQTCVKEAFVSLIISGSRRGAKMKGRLVRQAIADALCMKVEDLWPKVPHRK